MISNIGWRPTKPSVARFVCVCVFEMADQDTAWCLERGYMADW